MKDFEGQYIYIQLKIIKINVWKFDMFVELQDFIGKGKWGKTPLILGTKDFQWWEKVLCSKRDMEMHIQ